MVCRISKSITLSAPDLSSLKLLSLTNSPDAQDRDLEWIASICQGLETVDLSGTQVTNEGLRHLAPKEKGVGKRGKGCPGVRAIYFYRTRISDDGITLCMSKWHALETVGVSSFISTRLVREMRDRRLNVEGHDEDNVQTAKVHGEEAEPSWWGSLFGCA